MDQSVETVTKCNSEIADLETRVVRFNKAAKDALEAYSTKTDESLFKLKKRAEEFQAETNKSDEKFELKLKAFVTKQDYFLLSERLKGFVTWK